MGKHFGQIAVHQGRSHVVQTKCDHAGNIGPAHGNYPAKVKIVSQDHPALSPGLLDDLFVFQPLEPLVTQALMDEEHGLLTVRALNAVGALPAILNALEGAGLKAGDVRVRKNTLEDVFIQLTGRRLRE